MDGIRRLTLKAGALLALAALAPVRALAAAWNKEAFAQKSPLDAMKALGAGGAVETKDIVIEAPQIAENGEVVPIEIQSNIPGTRSLAVIVEKNPFPLVGKFDFLAGAVPYVKLNAKMGESSFVRVVADAGGKYFTAAREIKVTIGGCGG